MTPSQTGLLKRTCLAAAEVFRPISDVRCGLRNGTAEGAAELGSQWYLNAQRGARILLTANLFVRNRTSRRRITGDVPIVVNLTTYGARAHKVYLVIESIAMGTERPSRVILWLDEPQLLEAPPSTLRRLQRRGLEIAKTANYGPHKKYLPYVMQTDENKSSLPFCTVDDDFLLPRWWLKCLFIAYRQSPEHVTCYRAHRIKIDDSGKKIQSYDFWDRPRSATASFSALATGASGVIYPPKMGTVLARWGTAGYEIAPSADDIWLHRCALRSGVKVRQVYKSSVVFWSVIRDGGVALSVDNVSNGGNDRTIRRLYNQTDIDKIRSA